MLVSCPNCQTGYDVPDAALTGRSRTLRCASCNTKWRVPALENDFLEPAPAPEPAAFVPPAEPEANMAPDVKLTEASPASIAPAPDQTAILKAIRSAEVRAESKPSTRGLMISVLLVLVIIVAILAAHGPIGQFWPPSLRLYNALGLN